MSSISTASTGRAPRRGLTVGCPVFTMAASRDSGVPGALAGPR